MSSTRSSWRAKARQSEPFGPDNYDEDTDPENIEMDRKTDLRRCTADLLMLKRAKEWLLEDDMEEKP